MDPTPEPTADPTRHVDHEMYVQELLAKHRDELVNLARQTMRDRPGERLTGIIIEPAPPDPREPKSTPPLDERPTVPLVVGVASRAWAMEFLARFNLAATEFLPGDDREGDVCQLPIIVSHSNGLQCLATKFTV